MNNYPRPTIFLMFPPMQAMREWAMQHGIAWPGSANCPPSKPEHFFNIF